MVKVFSSFSKMVFRVVTLLAVFTVVLQDNQAFQYSSVVSSPAIYTSGGPHVSTYLVAIIRDGNWHKRCAGTLISDSFVLTAAQCVDCETAELILGAYDILVREKTQIRIDVDTTHIIFHPWYDPRTLDNDIALIKLPYRIALNRFINVAALPNEHLIASFGTKAHLTGWEHRLTGYSNILSQADVILLSKDKCMSFWPAARINDEKICASNTRRDAQLPALLGADCIIDAGSPLTIPGQPDMIIGILTGHAKCGSMLPEIFVNVIKYVGWIKQVIGSIEVIAREIEFLPNVISREIIDASYPPSVDVVGNVLVADGVY